jgi:hypothetical protein
VPGKKGEVAKGKGKSAAVAAVVAPVTPEAKVKPEGQHKPEAKAKLAETKHKPAKHPPKQAAKHAPKHAAKPGAKHGAKPKHAAHKPVRAKKR